MTKNKEKETVVENTETQKDNTKVEVEIETEETSKLDTEYIPEPEVELSEEEKKTIRILELEDKLTRKIAEFENYKKRTAREYQDMIMSANERTLGDILDVSNNFDRALEHKEDNMTLETFSEGVQKIQNQLHTIIEKYDVKPIEAIGKQFDPKFHQSLMHVESDEFEEGVVALEMNKGYMMGDKVIRHSQVGVAKPKESKENDKNQENTNE